MTFSDLKKLPYPDAMDLNLVLTDMLYEGLINYQEITSCYVNAIERENHKNKMHFEEACTNLVQLLGPNFKGKNKKEAIKRAIHTFNLTSSLPKNILNKDHEYTDEDKQYWDNFCKTIYGNDFN